ncbi:SRA stem-loop-interacting RNA-binding protein, mitochondrial [Xiphophorus maculatus]|uniref:SRA stem-loop interacting RNA binding protein n=1 Tax=Xiphophorus maculatus TaxID=8083 RepID=M4AMJ1_XIPMA|nr:SRA stem-loop-interacting RNA-binding protein, mitochondrial [Xiphophorus maculatus]
MAASAKKVLEVFVSKIPWTVAGKEMKAYFGQFGPVKRCILPFDKDTGFHRGFCWVLFSTEEGLNNALQKDPHILEGAKLLVQRNRRPFEGQKSNKDGDFD